MRGPLSLLEFLNPYFIKGKEVVLCGASPARYTTVSSLFLLSVLFFSD